MTAAGQGFTSRLADYDNRTEDKTVTSTGSYNATATQNGSAWVMHMVAFKAAAGSADTTPPTVSITAPNNNATVNDIVQVTANASDNVGVCRREVLRRRAATGAEDTAAPYGLSWDSTTVGNGAHTLTARARDTSGNTTTSAPVTVNVANTDHFQNEVLATGFDLPTTFEFLPDGRMLVAELQGRIKVLPPPYTQPDPGLFLQITNIGSAGVQQGIYDLVLDPNFATNHYYYVFYTLGVSQPRPRLALHRQRDSLTGTVPGSEFVLYEDPQNADAEHHGGALNFDNARQAAVHHRRALHSGAVAAADQPARQGSPDQPGRNDPDRQPVLRRRRTERRLDLGAGPAQPLPRLLRRSDGPLLHRRRRRQ